MSGIVHPAFRRFVDDVAAVVDAGGSEEEVTSAVAGRMRAFLDEGADVLPAAYMRPDAERYVMYPLHVAADGSFAIASAVWGVGQVTPIHDHGTWGVIGIYSGVEHEVRYEPRAERPPECLGERDIPAGEVVVCCTTDADVHEVSCRSDVPCVGIHVYGGDIGRIERHAYDRETGEVRCFVSGWARPREAAPA